MIVQLPGGHHDGTRWHREAELVALRGREEELLAGSTASPPALVTQVLARCVTRVGSVPADEDLVRTLTVGDRLYLLLRLREMTFGPRVTAVVRCPWPGCAAAIDLDFLLSEVPHRGRTTDDPVHEVELSAEALPGVVSPARLVRFRLPTGADQEELDSLLDHDPAVALGALLAACVVSVGSSPAGPEQVGSLGPSARAEIEAAMGAAAVGPALTMTTSCPECGRGFTLPFDVQDFFFGELATSSDLLYRQVHQLAYHYHWSEAEILDLPHDKRRRYLGLLSDAIEGVDGAVG